MISYQCCYRPIFLGKIEMKLNCTIHHKPRRVTAMNEGGYDLGE